MGILALGDLQAQSRYHKSSGSFGGGGSSFGGGGSSFKPPSSPAGFNPSSSPDSGSVKAPTKVSLPGSGSHSSNYNPPSSDGGAPGNGVLQNLWKSTTSASKPSSLYIIVGVVAAFLVAVAVVGGITKSS
jgi:hypothetical protein